MDIKCVLKTSISVSLLWANCAEGNDDIVVVSWKYSWFSCFTKCIHYNSWAMSPESTYQYYRIWYLTFGINNIQNNFENNMVAMGH